MHLRWMRIAQICCFAAWGGGYDCSAAGDASANVRGLPGDAVVIEAQRLPVSIHPDRVLLLWRSTLKDFHVKVS
jgi:hypothetical protein